MTIEPISSMMTVQAQQVQPARESAGTFSNNNAVRPAAEFTEGAAQDTPQVDGETLVVNNTMETDPDGGSEYSGANYAEAQSREKLDKAIESARENSDKTNEKIRKAVEDMNKQMFNSEAQFGIHEGTNRVTIKIVDKETKEVIKELPPEKTLDMIAKAWEMAGLMVDERR